MTFKDGAATIGIAALNGSAQASLAIATLASGTHSITAIYGGDINFNGSTLPAISVAIQQRTVTVSLSSSLNPSIAGQAVTFAVTVTSSYGTPSGDRIVPRRSEGHRHDEPDRRCHRANEPRRSFPAPTASRPPITAMPTISRRHPPR